MKRRQIAGFTMLEIVVSMAVLMVIALFAVQYQQIGSDQATGRSNADNLANFTQLASQYFISNRTGIEQAMTDGTGAGTYCRVNVNADGSGGTTVANATNHTCAMDATQLRAGGMWPSTLQLTAPGGGTYVAIFRQIYNGGTATGSDDMLIVNASLSGTLTPAKIDPNVSTQLLSSMSTMGGNGGMVPIGTAGPCSNVRSSSTYQACGNGWIVNLSDFIDSAQLTTFSTALPN